MRCIHVCEAHRRFITSHFHYSIIIASVFLASSTLFYVYSFPATLAAAPPKKEMVIVQINGQAQPPGFSPALLTLHINATVMFVNHAFPAKSYTLSADDGSFSSPPISPGGQWTITFHTPGSHTYRDTSATQTMVGELLVVDKSIHLLATPDPFVEATVVALIKNGQNPPDTIIIATHKHPTTSSSGSLIPLIILIIGISVSLTLLSILGISYYRRYRQRTNATDEDLIKQEDDIDDTDDADDDDDTDTGKHIQQVQTIVANLKKKLQVHQPFKAGASDDDDDDNDDWTN